MNKKGKIDFDYVVLGAILIFVIVVSTMAVRDMSSQIQDNQYNQEMCEELSYTSFKVIENECVCVNITDSGKIVGQQFNDLLKGDRCQDE